MADDALDDRELEDLVALLPALLNGVEALGFISRYLHPPSFRAVLEAAGDPAGPLAALRPRIDAWPERLAGVRDRLAEASDRVLDAFEALNAASDEPDGLRAIYRALGQAPRAQEALYPLAADLPPISRFFLEPGVRGDTDLQARLAEAEPSDMTGVMHADDVPGARGGFSAYVPEYYRADDEWPLVVALHGGAGNGRGFLWSWLRAARSYGAIVVSPTAIGPTWALSGRDPDTPNLMRILDLMSEHWRIDPTRLLLTGMSDGGTFSYVSGLEGASPFTHLAPIASSFHPVLAQMADRDRIRDLPIHVTHGKLDWMFAVDIAREAVEALQAAGARVTYRELDDLSHTYPREMNPEILSWLDGNPA